MVDGGGRGSEKSGRNNLRTGLKTEEKTQKKGRCGKGAVTGEQEKVGMGSTIDKKWKQKRRSLKK